MTFPTVQAFATGRTTAVDTLTHPVTLPVGIIPGELLEVEFAVDGAPTVSVNVGVSGPNWTKVGQASNGTIVTGAVFWKIAEGGDVLTLTTSTAEQSSHVSRRIKGARSVSGSFANGSSTNSNPPVQTPGGIAQDYLWIVGRAGDSTVVASATPASFANLRTLAAAGSAGASCNSADRALLGTSLDPATFTSASEQWVAWTVAVAPAELAVARVAAADYTPGPINVPLSGLPATRELYVVSLTRESWPAGVVGTFKLSFSDGTGIEGQASGGVVLGKDGSPALVTRFGITKPAGVTSGAFDITVAQNMRTAVLVERS